MAKTTYGHMLLEGLETMSTIIALLLKEFFSCCGG